MVGDGDVLEAAGLGCVRHLFDAGAAVGVSRVAVDQPADVAGAHEAPFRLR